VERIARRAGVNKRMIYHYYGSKDGLLRSIANGFYERLIAAGGSEQTSLGDAFADTQQAMVENLAWMRVAVWESLRHDRRWTPPPTQRGFWSAAVDGVKAAQAAGLMRNDVDAAQLQLSLVALVMFPFVLPHIAQMITGMRVTDPEFLASRAQSLRTFAECVETRTTSRKS
jgi:TetR/AcrR family transcriptional regulator